MAVSDWIQIGVAGVLSATLMGVLWYAWETRKQAKSTQRIAEAALRPVLVHWIEDTPSSDTSLPIQYRNIGNGPALDIRWEFTDQTRERVAMGTDDQQAFIKFSISGAAPFELVCRYADAHGNHWVSTLEVVERSGRLENGPSSFASA